MLLPFAPKGWGMQTEGLREVGPARVQAEQCSGLAWPRASIGLAHQNLLCCGLPLQQAWARLKAADVPGRS